MPRLRSVPPAFSKEVCPRMRRFAALLAALALALLCAGGFAMPAARAEGAEPTQPPLRHVLDIRFSVSPAALVEPGAVTLTFTIANTSEYDAENVYISSSDGLRTEPLGQIEAGDSRTFSRAHDVTEAELEAGRITYIFSHDGVAGDPDTVNYTVDCPIERAIARGEVEFTRQFSAAYARPGDVVTITYRDRLVYTSHAAPTACATPETCPSPTCAWTTPPASSPAAPTAWTWAKRACLQAASAWRT